MRRVCVILAALLLGACGWVEVGDPDAAGGRAPAPKTDAAAQDRQIRVQRGDSVYLIARRHGIAMRDIIERNSLKAPYHLREGQTLILPAPRNHVVAAGDSLWSISRRYDVSLAALVRLNGLKKPYTIYKGTTLRVPRRTEPPPEEIAATPAKAAPAPKLAPATAAGMVPVPSPAPVAQVKARPAGRAAAAGSGGVVPVPRRAPATASGRTRAAAAVPASKPAPQTLDKPPPAPVRTALKPLPPRAGRFVRPLPGPVVAGFGPQPDGLHNDGINIAAPRGVAVHSAEAGRVAYSGNELPGYGNLLLIRHQGGWVSAYAHNERLLVRRGDEVQRGQRIALVGNSGRVTTPQLHFELRRQGRAVDPTPHLEGG